MLAALLATATAGALSLRSIPDDTTDAEYFKYARDVFTARVIEVNPRTRHVVFEVVEVLKGAPPRRFTQVGPQSHFTVGSCDVHAFRFEPSCSSYSALGQVHLYIRGLDPAAGALPAAADAPSRFRVLRGQERPAQPVFLHRDIEPYRQLAAAAGTASAARSVQPSKEQRAYWDSRASRQPIAPLWEYRYECGKPRAIDSQWFAESKLAFLATPTSARFVDYVVRVDHRAFKKEVVELQFVVDSVLKGSPPATFTVLTDMGGAGGCGLDQESASASDWAFFLDKWRNFVSMKQAVEVTYVNREHWAELERQAQREAEQALADQGIVCGDPKLSDATMVASFPKILRVEILSPCQPGGCAAKVRVREALKGNAVGDLTLEMCWRTITGSMLEVGQEYVTFVDGFGVSSVVFASAGNESRIAKLRRLTRPQGR